MGCIESSVNNIILNMVKKVIEDHCSKVVYDFKADGSDNKACTGKGEVSLIPHKRLTGYMDSAKKRWRNRDRARNMSPYVNYSFDVKNTNILSTVEYHVKENNRKDDGMFIVDFDINITE